MESLFLGRKAIIRNTSGIDEVLDIKNSYLFSSDNDLEYILTKLIDTKIYLNDPCIKYPLELRKDDNLKKIEKLLINEH